MCKKVGHSLRVSNKVSVDEQLTMECTGHRSITGVRTYKHTSESQRLALSDITRQSTCHHFLLNHLSLPPLPLSLPPPTELLYLYHLLQSFFISTTSYQTTTTYLLLKQCHCCPPFPFHKLTYLLSTSNSASIPGNFNISSCASFTMNFNCSKE